MSCCASCATPRFPEHEPLGYISTHGAYFSPSPNIDVKDEHSERAILLLIDDPLGNSRILADNLALCLDCDVWVPHYFRGPLLNVYSHHDLRHTSSAKMSACTWVRTRLRTIYLLFKNRPAVVDARLSKFIKALQEENDYLKIGAVGYCTGGSTAIRLAATERIQSVVLCHPRKLKISEVQAIRVPSAWVCAEEDRFFSKSIRRKVEELIRRRGIEDIEHEFKNYKGTTHGFACQPDLMVAGGKEAYEGAFEQTVRWFSKTLPV